MAKKKGVEVLDTTGERDRDRAVMIEAAFINRRLSGDKKAGKLDKDVRAALNICAGLEKQLTQARENRDKLIEKIEALVVGDLPKELQGKE